MIVDIILVVALVALIVVIAKNVGGILMLALWAFLIVAIFMGADSALMFLLSL